ncbi:THUMP domain-containing class I SAM-dependent RNA methyltransferase [Jannaschia seohaensis]|uniref:Putative N6-adenine-specific DNA methylase n=1 Tax=Jannaschia seohaensis TaxID=475081 RepID=A0A2Y9AMN1_9RHOB|nr:RNA methyltransferase [Jannaschia seohaensis]PWJ19108.1 putative N6-adenine-specific DNA methylase [Jannaschia seohaensis]SSA45741.1 putative N6-adenine-specific DNA methylase [Jannaschia seohaensis]
MSFEIHLMAPPGLEPILAEEARAAGLSGARPVPGGVVLMGGWPEVWRANLKLRGAGRVSARIGSFRAFHLAQLDKRARKFPWREVLRPDVPVRVEVATNRKSKIYHKGAAEERIARAIHEELGAPLEGPDPVTVRARIDDNLVILSVDTSGDPLHKRGAKQAVGKAPLRETMAALLLRACGFDGSEPVLDPFCGSGTFVLEAAEIAAGLAPGRARRFAFERLATFDAAAWAALRDMPQPPRPDLGFYGSDRDAGAFAAARANAERAGVAELCHFEKRTVSEIAPPPGGPGLVIANPPYGTRIGDRKPLYGLYGALGTALRERFSGWRLGLVTSEPSLARATGLDLDESAPIAHGGLRVRLYRSGPL